MQAQWQASRQELVSRLAGDYRADDHDVEQTGAYLARLQAMTDSELVSIPLFGGLEVDVAGPGLFSVKGDRETWDEYPEFRTTAKAR